MKIYRVLYLCGLIWFLVLLGIIIWSNTRESIDSCIEDKKFSKEIEADISTTEDKRTLPWLNVFFGRGDLYEAEGTYYYPGEDYYTYSEVIQRLEANPDMFNGSKVNTTKSLHIGSKDARLVIIIFTNYQTPSFKNFVLNIFPNLNEEYIENGKIRLVFKDISLEKDAVEDSNTLRCAASYGKVEEYLDILTK